jgi:murein DD-endopeptidase MepM/ murein hydrolase activator NlpD
VHQIESLRSRESQLNGDLELLKLQAEEYAKASLVPAPKKAVPVENLSCAKMFVEANGEKVSVSRAFGQHHDADTGLNWNSNGWWLSNIKSEVHACASGVVVFVGKIEGRGKVVLIDHGGGSMTLYANLLDEAAPRLNRGEKVSAGALIGSARESLYFEMRRAGKPVDPALSLSKSIVQNFSL